MTCPSHRAEKWIQTHIAWCHTCLLNPILTALTPVDACLYSSAMRRGRLSLSRSLTNARATRAGTAPTAEERREISHFVGWMELPFFSMPPALPSRTTSPFHSNQSITLILCSKEPLHHQNKNVYISKLKAILVQANKMTSCSLLPPAGKLWQQHEPIKHTGGAGRCAMHYFFS